MDVWGPARVSEQDCERYFLLVVDDYTRYTTVFPLRSKVEVRDDLIPSIRAVRLQLREQFREDLPVLRLHSDRGGEFSSDLLRDFCHGEGILQSFTLPASPQKNGIAERRIGLVMEVAHTSMIHADAPHFLWPFAVQYAAHQLNLWPRVSLPETSPTLRWTGEVGDASVFRGPAPSGVSQVDPLPLAVPVEVAVDSGAARGAASGGAACGGAASGGAEHASAECMGAESEGAESRGSGGSAAGGTGAGGAGAAGPGGARTSGTGAAGAGGVGGAGAGDPGAGGVGAGDPGAGGTSDGGAGAGGTGARGAGASSPGGAGVAAGAGGTGGLGAGGTGARDPGPGGAGAGGAGAGDPGAGGTGAGGAGAGGARAGGTRAGGIGAGGAGARGAKAGDPGAGGAGAGGAGAGGPSAGGTLQQCPFFVPPQPSSLPPSDSVLRQ
ncbi:unnamed protein product, partial [Closterium sp. NIES-54]